MIHCVKCLIGKKSYINIRILAELNQTWTNRLLHNLNGNEIHRIRLKNKNEENKERGYKENRKEVITFSVFTDVIHLDFLFKMVENG